MPPWMNWRSGAAFVWLAPSGKMASRLSVTGSQTNVVAAGSGWVATTSGVASVQSASRRRLAVGDRSHLHAASDDAAEAVERVADADQARLGSVRDQPFGDRAEVLFFVEVVVVLRVIGADGDVESIGCLCRAAFRSSMPRRDRGDLVAFRARRGDRGRRIVLLHDRAIELGAEVGVVEVDGRRAGDAELRNRVRIERRDDRAVDAGRDRRSRSPCSAGRRRGRGAGRFALQTFEEDRGAGDERAADGDPHAGKAADAAGLVVVVVGASERAPLGSVRLRVMGRPAPRKLASSSCALLRRIVRTLPFASYL